MSAEDPDDRFTLLLASLDDALAAGTDDPSPGDLPVPADLRERLGRDADWCRVVRKLWPLAKASRDDRVRSDVSAAFLPMTHLGRFEIRRELGRGAFGVVFLAYDPHLNREIALKVPRAEALVTAELRMRFQQEAHAAAGLDHPNLVPVYECGQQGPICYIATAFCPGITLAAWLRQASGRIPVQMAAHLVATLANAVDHAHRRGVLHRDLKPSNIMLTPPGETIGAAASAEMGFIPRVLDFGLAKIERAADASTVNSPTLSGTILGTPQYMAPEQASGQSSGVGPPADIYSLGAILYELLAGQPPFRGDTALDTLLLVRSQEPTAPSRVRPGVPRDLETICLKCLHKEPDRRYGSMAELADDLRRFLAHEPIQARRIGVPARIKLWCRRHPALAATITAAVFAVLAVAGVGYYQVAEERDHVRMERDRAQSNLYLALIGEARAEMKARDTGWWWKAMKNIQEAAALDVPGRDPKELRELAIECMGSIYSCFRLQGTWEGHAKDVTSLALSADGSLVASGSRDSTVRIWSMPHGEVKAVLTGHTLPVTGVAFSDPLHVVSASADGTVRRWKVDEPAAPPEIFTLNAGAVTALAASADGGIAAGCRDGTIHLISARGSESVLAGHVGPVKCLAFTASGKHLFSGADDKTVRVWDVARGKQVESRPVPNPPSSIALAQLSHRHDLDQMLIWSNLETYGFRFEMGKTERREDVPATHVGGVTKVHFDSRGRLLSASSDGSVKMWVWYLLGPTYVEAAIARGEWGAVSAVVSKDDVIIAAYADGRIRAWELLTPEQRVIHVSQTQSCAFIGNERRWVNADMTVDFAKGLSAEGISFRPAPIEGIVMHPSGKRVAVGDGEGVIRVWDYVERRELLRWDGLAGRITAIVGCPLGTRFASAGDSGLVKVWDWEGKLLHAVATNLDEVHALAWTPDGRFLAASGRRGVCLWDSRSKDPPRLVREQMAATSALAGGPGMMAMDGPEHTIEIRAVPEGKLLRTLRGHTDVIRVLAFAPDGRLFSGGQDRTIRAWDAELGQQLQVFEEPQKNATVFALYFDAQKRFMVAHQGGQKVWDLRRGEPVGHLFGGGVICGQFAHDGSTVVSGTVHGAVIEHSLAKLEEALKAARGPEKGSATAGVVRVDFDAPIIPGGAISTVWGVAASRDGRWVATACHDGTVNLWDARTMKLVRSLRGHKNLAWCVAFSPDSKYLASGSDEILVWDVGQGNIVHRLEGHDRLVVSVAFHPTQPWLASSSNDGSVRLWDLSGAKPNDRLYRFDKAVYSVAFSPDGRWLSAGLHTHQIAVWNTQTWPVFPTAPDRTLIGHKGAVWSVGFSPDGRFLASGSEQGLVILWDGQTFERVVTLRGGASQVRCVTFSSDAQLLAAAAYGGPTVVWDIPALRSALRAMNLDW